MRHGTGAPAQPAYIRVTRRRSVLPRPPSPNAVTTSRKGKGRLPDGRRPLTWVTPYQRKVAFSAPKVRLSVATGAQPQAGVAEE